LNIRFESEVQFLKGVGPRRAQQLAKLEIKKVGDLLFHFPVRYEDRRDILPIEKLEIGRMQTVRGSITSAGYIGRRRGGRMFRLLIQDETGVMSCLWFSAKGDYLAGTYRPGLSVIVTGRVAYSRYQHCFEMAHPDISTVEGDETDVAGLLLPVYPLTEGIGQKQMRKIIASALENCPPIPEVLPEPILRRFDFPARDAAVRQIHLPDEKTDSALLNGFTSPAHKRMIFEEFFMLESALAIIRSRNTEKVKGVRLRVTKEHVKKVLSLLPFQLTADQRKALNEIARDLKGEHPMNRLLQGDVGCGKTAVATIVMMIAAENGYQSALMAPTEILAAQHFRNISALTAGLPFRIALLTAGRKGKAEAKKQIAEGEADLVIGTHALIQETVSFRKLGVVVIDEQHRFGVMQRGELISKGERPNTLIMTATPIPRTLALTLYSDLDISVIREMPKGRGRVETRIIGPAEKRKANLLIHREISKGRQGYIIYPLVEESEKSELKAATEMYEAYRSRIFPDLRLGLVHGRMKPAEKEKVMSAFMNRELDLLISTTVVEVGIDQPNATVMMVEHAERFGLAQLHQLRGRIGRGPEQSYCLLAIEYPLSKVARERLKIMVKTTDGFLIAEKDLELRGTGDFFGTRQSGLPAFRIANLVRDFSLLKLAKQEAFALVHSDPELEKPPNLPLRRALSKTWKGKVLLAEIG
jgi:ATP-dependent DNA helicase RecG